MTKFAISAPGAAPMTIAATRGGIVESRHRVHCAVMDAGGALVAAWGDVERPVFMRSAVKPLQALPLVESGAADAYGLGDKQLALACASHTGEPVHVEAVRDWLARIGLSEDDLECGSHWPTYEPAMRELAARGETPTPAHNNCSGKHSGFLTTALHLGEETGGYVKADHPVQRRLRRVMGEMCGMDLRDAPTGIDGCSIPTIALPLRASALGIARFAAPDALPPERAAACRRLQAAVAAEPMMIAGSKRMCTALNGAAGGRILVKTGAEGCYIAALPEKGIGVALKAADGATRAAQSALGAVLDHLGMLDDEIEAAIADYAWPTLKNWNGMKVGEVRPIAEAGF